DIWDCFLSRIGIISIALCPTPRTDIPGAACWAKHLPIDRGWSRTSPAFHHLSPCYHVYAWLHSCFYSSRRYCQHTRRVSAGQPVPAAAGWGNYPDHYWLTPYRHTQIAL